MKDVSLASVDLNHLRALHALLEESSVSRAAARLGITPPAASNALKRLRGLLGDPLLVSAGGAMVRTPRGEALRGPASHFMSAAEAVLRPLTFDASGWEGTFPLLVSDYVYAAIAAPLEKLLAKHLPHVHLVVTLPGSIDTEVWLRDHDGLAIDPQGGRSSRGFADLLYEDRLVLVFRRRHPCGSTEISLDDFCELTHLLVAPRGQPGSIVDRRLEELGRARQVARIVPTFLLAAHLLMRSNLVSTLPARFAGVVASRFGLVSRELPFETDRIPFWISGHRRHAQSEPHLLMRSLIAKAANG